jgi:hypothetical protein
MVNLGCLTSSSIVDISIFNFNQPTSQVVSTQTGSTESQPMTQDGVLLSDGFTQILSGNLLGDNNKTNTSYQATVNLTSDVSLYNISAVASGYSNIVFSQEGLIWTLWPLVGNKSNKNQNYFDDISFGTSRQSRYPIGQLGYFIQNGIIGCTPFGALNTDDILNNNGNGIIPGIESLNQALIYTTGQYIAIVVIKVTEEVARILNPSAGISAEDREIYVGYDGWATFLTSCNPIGPMMAQSYITPQTITGNLVNYQTIIPPNFPTTMYYKNVPRMVPIGIWNF